MARPSGNLQGQLVVGRHRYLLAFFRRIRKLSVTESFYFAFVEACDGSVSPAVYDRRVINRVGNDTRSRVAVNPTTQTDACPTRSRSDTSVQVARFETRLCKYRRFIPAFSYDSSPRIIIVLILRRCLVNGQRDIV